MGVASLALTGSLLVSTASPAGATSSRPACGGAFFSPRFAVDHTVLCTTFEPRGTVLYRSVDGGHSWGPGRTLTSGHHYVSTAFSPWFARDHTVWAATPDDLYVSHDGAKTFGLFDSTDAEGYRPSSGVGQGLRTFVVPADATEPARVGLIEWDYGRPAGSNGVEYLPVNGAFQRLPLAGPADAVALDYLVPPVLSPTKTPVVIAGPFVTDSRTDPVATVLADEVQVRDCTVTFACVTNRFQSAPGQRSAFAGGDLNAHGGYAFQTAGEADNAAAVYRTGDYGQTWTRWSSIERLVPVPPSRSTSHCNVLHGVDGPAH